MKIDEQLCAEAELLIPRIQTDGDSAHILHSYLNWYRGACNGDDRNAQQYKKWLKTWVAKAKQIVAEQRYKENHEN